MYLASLRAVQVAPPAARGMVRDQRAGLPAPVKKAVTAVAVGAALQVGVAVAGRYLARQAASTALGAITPKPQKPAKVVMPRRTPGERMPVAVTGRGDDETGEALAVAETFIFRRVWIRR